MKIQRLHRGPAFMLARCFAAFMSLLISFGANADGGDSSCLSLYGKSGATPGTSQCVMTVTSNTPSGMGSYGCRNDQPLIESWCGTPTPVDPDKNCAVADPVLPANGVTTISESDFVSGDSTPLIFTRTYRSSPSLRTDAGIGATWFHNWQRQLGLANATASTPQVIAYRADGSSVTFSKTAGVWSPVDGSALTLTQGSSSWTLTDLTTETSESYSAQGILLSVNTRTGYTTTLTYSDSTTPSSVAPATGLLVEVTGHIAGGSPSADLALRFSYDSHWRVVQMTDPTGAVTQYSYDSHGNLSSVTLPDGSVRRYIYDDPRFLSLLTGMVDESGSRVATWTYGSQGRVAAVSHPDTTRNVQFVYGGGTTTLSDSQGSTSLASSLIAGMQRPTVISSTSGAGSVSWDATGHLLTQKTGNGDSIAYSYDDAGRPIQSTAHNGSGTAITSIKYADAQTLRPATIASPGWMRAYVYDSNGNLTGVSELTTDDPTGANGLGASTAGGQQRTYGMTYDSYNRLNFLQRYENGVKTGEWWFYAGLTGDLRQIYDKQNGQYYTIGVRDSAHRAVSIAGPGFTANPSYDSRGRLSFFQYWENAGPTNGNVQRFLVVQYSYAPDGSVANRTATVSTNNGPAVQISDDETNKWLTNYENGVSPAGPPVNLLEWKNTNHLSATSDIEPICASCYLWAAQPDAMRLYYSSIDRGPNQAIWESAPNASPTPNSLLGMTKCADGCAEERASCKVTCARAASDFDQPNVWWRKFQKCFMGCLPARCGGNSF